MLAYFVDHEMGGGAPYRYANNDKVIVLVLPVRLLYFQAFKTHRPIRRTVIFSLGILEKNNDECILILV